MLGIVARKADSWNSFGTLDQIRERNAILDGHCDRIGRDPRAVLRSLYYWTARADDDCWASLGAFHEMVGRHREAGIEEFVIDMPREGQEAVLEKVAADVPRLRALTSA